MLNSAKRLNHYSSGLKDADIEASDCRARQAGEEQTARVPAEALLGVQSASVFNPLLTSLNKEGAWKQSRNSTERVRCSVHRNLRYGKQQPQCDRFI